MKKIYTLVSILLFGGFVTFAQQGSDILFSPSSNGAEAAVMDPTTGVKEFNQSSIFIYSFENDIFIDCSSIENKTGIVEVFNLNGVKVISQPIQNESLNRINLSRVSTGYYIVKVLENQNITTKKVFLK